MCLFHMLTGEYAHYSANYSDILVSVCTRPLPKLREKAPWLPEAVEQWFQRACAQDPLDRFQSADEMTEALQATGSASPKSKHQSVPEGRIAPETLVGFAPPPALAASPVDAAQLGFARTQALSPGPGPAPGAVTAPIAVVVHPEARASVGRGNTPPEWTPPRRNFVPWVAGAGVGLLALALLGLTLRLLRSSEEPDRAPPSALGTPSGSTSPNSEAASDAAPSSPEPATLPTPEPVSSVAAERAAAPAGAASRRPETAKKAAKGAAASPAPLPTRAPAPKGPGADLGF
jgi:hypothetical protein